MTLGSSSKNLKQFVRYKTLENEKEKGFVQLILEKSGFRGWCITSEEEVTVLSTEAKGWALTCPLGGLDVGHLKLYRMDLSLTFTKEFWRAAERLVRCITGERAPAVTAFPLIADQRIWEFPLQFKRHRRKSWPRGILTYLKSTTWKGTLPMRAHMECPPR